MENQKKFCPECGQELNAEQAFCPNCGTKQAVKEEITEVQSEVEKSAESEVSTDEVKEENIENTTETPEAKVEESVEALKTEAPEITEVPKKEFCKNCGAELKDGIAFCGECGLPRNEAASNNIAQATTVAPAVPATPRKPINKKLLAIIGAAVAVVVIAVGIVAFVLAQPKDILKNAKPTFSGYNSQGTFQLSKNTYRDETDLIGKKIGLSANDIKDLETGGSWPADISQAKQTEYTKYLEDTKWSYSKSDNLSNGDKVTVSIKTSLKGNPIKSGSKTFTVSGLKKSTTYTIADVLKAEPVKVTGFNHFGTYSNDNNSDYTISSGNSNSSDNDNSYDSSDSSDNSSSDLTNGDTLTVQLSSSYIEEQKEKGKILSGSDTTTVDVSGLQDTPTISNLNDLLTQEDTVVRAANKSTSGDFGITYTITRLDSYFVGTDVSEYNYDSSNDGGFSVVTIYKIVSHNNSDDNSDNDQTNYETYGYTGLSLNGGKVDVSKLTDSNKYTGNSNDDSEQNAVDDLKSDYPSATKIN